MHKAAILYDSYCKLCNKEIEFYRKQDKKDVFDYIDIMHPEFDSEIYQLSHADVHKYFHVVDKEKNILIGIDAFYYIWCELNTFSLLQKMYQFKFGKYLMELGYQGFVKVRPLLPREKCDDYCKI